MKVGRRQKALEVFTTMGETPGVKVRRLLTCNRLS